MSAPEFPKGIAPSTLKNCLKPLSLWAASPTAEAHLESIFGRRLNWASAFRHLAAFQRADFSLLPPIRTLASTDMPGLWGGYSRDTREIFLSAECPEESLSAVLIEEIGHFLDQELCLEETPGEEGALFAATVLGLPISNSQREAFSSDNDLLEVSRNGQPLLVEGAKSSGGKKSGSGRKSGGRRRGGKSKSVFSNSEVSASGGGGGGGGGGGTPSASPSNVPPSSESSSLGGGSVVLPPSQDGNLRIEQKSVGDTLVGSQGNDTFVIFDQNVTIDDSYGGTDVVESKVSFSLANLSPIENLFLTGASHVDGTGNARANVVSGNSGNNVLDGGAGADTLQAGAGNDTLLGGEGSDLLEGGEGADLLDGGLGIDSMSGGAGNDTYYVGSASEAVIEAPGGGTDTIITSDRSITSLTYANIERVVYVGALDGGGGSELVSTLGTENDDYLFGGAGNDSLFGKAGNDTLEGKGGNDFLDGGSGADIMSGGTGDDTYVVDASTDVIQENPNAGTDVVISSVSYALGDNLENLTLNPALSGADANINGKGNSLENIIAGNAGSNQLNGGGGADTIIGGAGDDILDGGALDGASDSLFGGSGNDTYQIDSERDVINDTEGTADTVETTISFDIGSSLAAGIEHLIYKGSDPAKLTGNDGNNSLISEGSRNDTIIAGAGNDTLVGGGGTNSLIGGTGDDFYIVTSSSDTQIDEDTLASGGLDTVLLKISGSSVSYSLKGDSGVENIIYEGLGKTTLIGSNSDNTIIGGDFGNSLSGSLGHDYLIGGVQADTLVGGYGNDTLDGKGGTNSLIGGAGDDYYFTDSQTVNILENADEGRDTIRSSVSFSLSYSNRLRNSIEGLYLTGAASLSGTGNSLDNTITGNDGANALSGKEENDIILGGLGADYITGDEGDDSLVGGGDIQGDVLANASTPIILASGQTYTGQINSRNDTDWIRVDLLAGVAYTFAITAELNGAEVVRNRSDVAFGAQGSDTLASPFIGDLGSGEKRSKLLFKANGLSVDSSDGKLEIDPSLVNNFKNIDEFTFVTRKAGTFYIPVSGAGPALGSYSVTLTDIDNPVVGSAWVDNASNTLIGGQGRDTLVAGNGRDAQGMAIGDLLLGGTNVLVGRVDTDDTLFGGADDTLFGGDGNDSLDGGNGANSLIGGKGNDYYFIRSSLDQIFEKVDGGDADAMIVNFSAKLGGKWDIVLDPDEPRTGPAFTFANIENVTLTGVANTSVLGSPNSDKIVGNFGNNIFEGGWGDDTLLGEGGNDSLDGGEGADYLDGGNGVNTMLGGSGADTYIINDRNDMILGEKEDSLDGGEDLVRTYFNFDPIQGLDENGENSFAPNLADYSPSITKSPSFASRDLASFYNLEHFDLLGAAVYGVGNALANSITAGSSAAILIGNGGTDTLKGDSGADSLFGDTPDFYATPDLYAAAPKDTMTKEFLLKVIGKDAGNDYAYTTTYATDYLDGGAGDDYIDGGRGFDVMIGGAGNDTFVQDNVEDYIVAGGGANQLITSVNINQAPDGISKLMLVVAKQGPDSGQDEVASFASVFGTKNGNNRSIDITTGFVDLSLTNANALELIYAPREGQIFENEDLLVGDQEDDLKNPGKFQYDLSWLAGEYAANNVAGYTVRYKKRGGDDIWHTYVNGKSQDFQGTQANPVLTVNNLDDGTYDFQVTAIERVLPSRSLNGKEVAQHVTLQGGAGNDAVLGIKLSYLLPGGLQWDSYTDPLVQNNPNFGMPLGFIFNSAPYQPKAFMPSNFSTYLDGGFGNDILFGDYVNDGSGDDYVFQGVAFKGLNTLVGGQGSDTFVVTNGGNAIGDEFDWVLKYEYETPVVTQAENVGSSLNGGQHNLIVSHVDFLTLSDELVNQGKFIDQLVLAGGRQFGMGNRLENYVYDSSDGIINTLVGNTGRDSIVANSKGALLIGGTAHGADNVGLAVKDFASISDGGNGLTNSIFRDTDPVVVNPNGPGAADPSQFWFISGYYGQVYDWSRNQDTLIANSPKFSTLDGGAGHDSLIGSGEADPADDEEGDASKGGDMFVVSAGFGGKSSKDTLVGDAVFGNGGNDTVTFTDSDYLWWTGNLSDSLLEMHSYTIAEDISNLVLQSGAPSARDAYGNKTSTGNDHKGWFDEIGSNLIVGNEFDNIIDGGGVGGKDNGGGFDTYIGGTGADKFVVSGYTGAESSSWAPAFKTDDSGKFVAWDASESVYLDADYVTILDFSYDDVLSLKGKAEDYWIGAAPTGVPEKVENASNVYPLGIGAKPGTTSFGIYKSAPWSKLTRPDLVAHVSLVGGLTLDTLSLVDAAPAGALKSGVFVPLGDEADHLLGWGQFYKLEGTDFANQYLESPLSPYTRSASNANLAELVRFGNDSLVGDEKANVLNGYNGNDTLLGGAGNDVLLGGNGNDSLLGQDGVDYIEGGAGSDLLDAGGFDGDGDDLFGGTGNDTYYVYESDDHVVELDGEGLADLTVALYDGHTLAENVENLLLGNGVLRGSGNTDANRLTGNPLDNYLTGGAGADTLEGKGTLVETDTLAGGAGNDFYIVDSTLDQIIEDGIGTDTDTVLTSFSFDLSNALVNGGTGVENLIYSGTGNVSLTGNALANTITGGAGNDTLDGGSLAGGVGDNNIDSLIGGNGDDFYVFRSNSGNDVIYDTMGTDAVLAYGDFDLNTLNIPAKNPTTIENLQLASIDGGALYGNSLNNVITGNIGNDTLDGRGNPDTLSGDTLIGGSGNDYYIVDSTRDEIVESALGGLDTVETTISFDLSNTLIGGLKNIENIKGNNGGITLTGNINANSLFGGTGSQYMVGGIGDDTYTVGAGDVASESEDQGTDLVVADTSYTLGANIENLNLVGSAISGTGNSLANIITGNGLANSLDGGAGADTLIGNGGGDTFVVDNLGDSLVGGAGTDFVVSSITYTLGSNIEHLTLIGSDSIGGTGNSGDNTITGNASNNTLDGGTGKNTLVGLGGDDIYVINSLDDIVVETSGGGTDLVTAKVTGYILTANVENLTLDTGIVAGTGNILANTITGNASSNSLNGDAGNDTLVGSLNRGIGEIDTLTGGSGIDLFILGDKVNPFYAAAPSAGDYALITDFAVADGDQLQLKDLSSGAHASTVKGYLIGGQIGGYDYTGASGANCYLYRDNTSDGIVNDGDNLIAAIDSTGGTGGGGILRTSDLNTVGFFVI